MNAVGALRRTGIGVDVEVDDLGLPMIGDSRSPMIGMRCSCGDQLCDGRLAGPRGGTPVDQLDEELVDLGQLHRR